MIRGIVAEALFVRGTGLLESSQARRAFRHLALASRPSGKAPFSAAAALAAHQAGEVDAAVRYAERALQLESARDFLGAVFLHGESYFDLLSRIHQHLRPRTYVEIGVECGESLRLVLPETRVLGVDPEPRLTYQPPANVRVFKMTSDEFFARHDVREELGGRPVDLAFIDGMHHFEYALRDFMNIERCCEPGSTILMHDCFPRDRRTAQRERVMAFWSGDVWRLVVLLKKYRPELEIHTIAAPPTGLCIVRKLDPASRFIARNLGRLCDEFMRLDYSFLGKQRAAKLNLSPNDWESVARLLGSARQL